MNTIQKSVFCTANKTKLPNIERAAVKHPAGGGSMKNWFRRELINRFRFKKITTKMKKTNEKTFSKQGMESISINI